MGGTVLLHDEMHVVGRHDLDTHLGGQLEDAGVGHGLVLIHVGRAARDLGLMQLHLEVVVVAEHVLVPLDGLAGPVHVPGDDVAGNLARDTGGQTNDAFVVLP